ncbi:MAG: metallophosphoesterase [Dehalococcoidia bacterium]
MALSILHISDLHRDPTHPITNDALSESLVRDVQHFLSEQPVIRPPDLIVISGDLVLGVRPNTPDPEHALHLQYEEVGGLLSVLADEFLGGDHGRVVLVPGNHDVSYPHVMSAIRPISLDEEDESTRGVKAEYLGRLNVPGSSLRWSWDTLSFFELFDLDRYLERMKPFADFYQNFYGHTRSYTLDPGKQFDLFDYPEFGVTIVGFNSCYGNDPLHRGASIHPDCIASAHRLLREDDSYNNRLKIAVWHHSTSGPPDQTDYMDADTLQVLIDCGFSLALHGHQHKPQFIDERFQFGIESKITVISAGTLCGGPGVLPSGQPHSYNMVEVDTTTFSGTLHLRQMQNTSFNSPIWGPGAFPSTRASFIPFSLQPQAYSPAENIASVVAEAESLLSGGDPEKAVELLRPFSDHELARRILLDAFVATNDTKGLIELYYPPTGVAEVVYVANALSEENSLGQLRELLESPFVAESTNPAIVEIRQKYSGRLR